MKNLFTCLIIISFILVVHTQSMKADGGTTCATAVTMASDTNTCNFSSSSYQWFQMSTSDFKKITLSNCGLTTSYTYFYVYTDCNGSYLYSSRSCGSGQATLTFLAEPGVTYYIRWINYNNANFNWVRSISDPLPGDFLKYAIPVTEGIKNTISNEQEVWYKYVPDIDCRASIKGLKTYNYYNVYVYNDINSSYIYASSSALDVNFLCKKGVTYYFSIGRYSSGQNVIPWQLSEVPAKTLDGIDCQNAALIKNNLNHVNNNIIGQQWFKYKAEQNGILSASTCGLTLKSTSVSLSRDCNNFINYGYNCGKQANINYSINKGDSVYLVWSSPDSAEYDFKFQFSPIESVPGGNAQNALSAFVGQNQVNNSISDQWFKIVAPSASKIHITSCGLTKENTLVYFYNGYPSNINSYWSYNDDFCNFQSDLSHKVQKGDTCYIRWSNYYTNARYDWNLEFLPLSTEAVFKDFNVYADYDTTRIITSKIINAKTKSINLIVSKNVSTLNNLYTFYKTSDGATVLNENYNQFYNGNWTDYTNPLNLLLIDQSNSVINKWTVNITKATTEFHEKNFLTFNLSSQVSDPVINTNDHTITAKINWNADSSYIYTHFTVSTGASVSVSSSEVQTSTYFNFSSPLTFTVMAEDSTSQDWIVTVTHDLPPKGENCDNLLIADFGINTIPVQNYQNVYYKFIPGIFGRFSIYNPNSRSNLHLNVLKNDCNGSQVYYGQINSGDSMVLSSEVNDTFMISMYIDGNQKNWNLNYLPVSSEKKINSFFVEYNYLHKARIDSINHIITANINWNEPLSLWTNFELSAGATAKVNNVDWESGQYHDFSADVTLTIVAQDGSSQDWTVSIKNLPVPTEKDFLSFALIGQTGDALIDSYKNTVNISVADTSNLVLQQPYFFLSTGATAYVGSTWQNSGYSVVDFTNPVTYTITAADYSQKTWNVSVVKGTLINDQARILYFHLDGQTHLAITDTSSKTLNVELAYGTNLNSLIAGFTLTAGASAKVGLVDQVSGLTPNDFSLPVVYTVTAEDGVTTQNWTVNVTLADASSETSILSYLFAEQIQMAQIDTDNKSIDIEVALGTNLQNLIAGFTLSKGASAKVNNVDQISCVTANDFSFPIVYAVKAEDSTTIEDWTVNVKAGSKNGSSEAKILSFKFAEQILATVINSTKKTIKINVAAGTNVKKLIAGFTISNGALVKVGNIEQMSGFTENDFSSPVVYNVLAENGVTTQKWTVTVIIGIPSSVNEINNEFDINVYPNPSNGNFNLKINSPKFRIASISVFSMEGKIMYSNKIDIENAVPKVINLDVAPGIYLLEIKSDDFIHRQKIQIIH